LNFNILNIMNNYYIYSFSFILIGILSLACSTKNVINPTTETITLKEKHAVSFSVDMDGPIDKENIKYLNYFEVADQWKLICNCDTTIQKKIITVPTSSGKSKSYQPWALAKCNHEGQAFELFLYLQVPHSNNPLYKNDYFIPFKDATNGETTYGGGRYINGKIYEVIDGKVTLDFNQAYNPYCAYSTGYNCPIPPRENHLEIAINAGEKAYNGPIKKK